MTSYKEAKTGTVGYNNARQKFNAAFPTWCLKPEELLTFA